MSTAPDPYRPMPSTPHHVAGSGPTGTQDGGAPAWGTPPTTAHIPQPTSYTPQAQQSYGQPAPAHGQPAPGHPGYVQPSSPYLSPQQYYGPPPSGSVNGLAIASLVTAIVGLSFFAVLFGHMALSQIRRSGAGGRVMALIGLGLGYAGIVAGVIGFFAFIISTAASGL
ncbi:MAG: DUF4190 domain-containing protein [Beutenbergiaceae bacterium]